MYVPPRTELQKTILVTCSQDLIWINCISEVSRWCLYDSHSEQGGDVNVMLKCVNCVWVTVRMMKCSSGTPPAFWSTVQRAGPILASGDLNISARQCWAVQTIDRWHQHFCPGVSRGTSLLYIILHSLRRHPKLSCEGFMFWKVGLFLVRLKGKSSSKKYKLTRSLLDCISQVKFCSSLTILELHSKNSILLSCRSRWGLVLKCRRTTETRTSNWLQTARLCWSNSLEAPRSHTDLKRCYLHPS